MELVYLRSPTGQQHERARRVLQAIQAAMPELRIREVDPADDPEFAQRYRIKYAPGLIIDGRIEFVGIPREKMLLERLQLRAQGPPPPSPPPPAKPPAPAVPPATLSPEERQRRVEEARRRAEEIRKAREGAAGG